MSILSRMQGRVQIFEHGGHLNYIINQKVNKIRKKRVYCFELFRLPAMLRRQRNKKTCFYGSYNNLKYKLKINI